ncbi:helix-turn-helix transcriptional regulator [Agarilytica rhodophyticola]|uniref:helix-turn-helix transcriptional regulator n=1 Tax=Agarilytica rhodophyticola TaxID=1737490 RepID=UPI001C201165|nr:LuxR C-terminal-related transcriptional regulator [Agarilytica rhodophyticola]
MKINDIEKFCIQLSITIVFISAIADYYFDFMEGATWYDLMLDSAINIFLFVILAYILFHRPRATRARNKFLEDVVRKSNTDLIRWKNKAAKLLEGLGVKIDEQFNEWGLSNAEKEVAILLIKGVSTREISKMRSTTEKTVRHQASQIYNKAKLEGRAELAAFFLEDLLLPKTEEA